MIYLIAALAIFAFTSARSVGALTGNKQRGIASWYGPGYHGKLTANGERFDKYAMTAAHKKLPFGTRVRVTDVDTGRSVTVRINDRGPFVAGRIIDLSEGAASVLGMKDKGLADVEVETLK